MKKYIALVLALVSVLGLVGCNRKELQKPKGQDYFNGTILEIQDTYILVECFEVTSGAVSVGTEAQVRLDVVAARGVPKMNVGNNVRVVFAGVQEKDPVSFDTVFAIDLLDENGEVIFPE